MMFFLVTVSGDGVKLQMDDSSSIDVGFVKNEGVVACSASHAALRAVETVTANLQEQALKGGLSIGILNIHADATMLTLKFWKLLFSDGFVFYPKTES